MRAADLPLYYNAVEILEHNLDKRAGKTALYTVGRDLTFGEVSEEANRVGNGLRRLGVRVGEAVALLCLDVAEWVTSFFGTLKVGAISVGLNTLLTSAEYAYMLRDCRARVLIVHQSLWSKIAPIVDQQPFLEHVIVVGGGVDSDNDNDNDNDKDNDNDNQRTVAYTEWIASESPILESAATHREDFCTLNYSSGTTGQPKGILHAHKDLPLISEYWGKKTLGLREDDRTFAGAKLFFTYGTGGNLLFPYYVGASIVLFAGKPSVATDLLEMVDRFKPTIFYNAPTGYAIALSIPDFETRYDLSSVRLCVSGGENLPAPIWQQWKARTGIPIINGVGCTEVYHNFLSNRPDDILPGSSGKPVPGFELRIVDSEGQDLPVGETGNLLVKGDTIALSYLHQYERSRRTFLGEWFSTGDQFRQDEAGYFWHAGRSDDMLKVGGIWVSPMEVESTLINHPAVVECAVVAWHDGDHLIKPKAFVILNDPDLASEQLAEELIHYCRQQMAAYKRPRVVEFVTSLPKTATGKIQRFKLRLGSNQ